MNPVSSADRRNRIGWDVIEALSVGVILFEFDGTIREMNSAAARVLDIDLKSALGQKYVSVMPADSVVRQIMHSTCRLGRSVADVMGRVSDKPDANAIRCRSTVLRRKSGELYGALCHFEDVSDLNSMEAEVQQLDRLATIGRFASGIAHEIRNPLMGIYAGVQFLEKTLELASSKQKTTFTIISDEVERLNRIVTDLLGAARPPEPELRTIDPNAVLQKAHQLLEDEADRAGIALQIVTDDTLPGLALDPDLATQVLLNLGRNAIQAAGENGEVSLSCSLSSGSPHEGMLPREGSPVGIEFTVKDNGPGVPPEELETIFEPFQTSKKRGTGLGLYISYQIMERHRGALWVQSELGHGAKFIARFPYQTQPKDAEVRE